MFGDVFPVLKYAPRNDVALKVMAAFKTTRILDVQQTLLLRRNINNSKKRESPNFRMVFKNYKTL